MIADFSCSVDAEVPAQSTEIQSGRTADRPGGLKELQIATVGGTILAIAKLESSIGHAAYAQKEDICRLWTTLPD